MKKKSEKKTVGRIGSFLLGASMIVGGLALSPLTTVEVQAAITTKNVNLRLADNSIAGIGNPTAPTENNDEWVGSKVYFGQDTVNNLWRVLDANTGLLFANDKVTKRRYDESSREWDNNCELRGWLNGSEYKSNSIIFSSIEQNAIQTNANGAIRLLTIDEAKNSSYGFYNSDLFTFTRGASETYWWLRSPGSEVNNAVCVAPNGYIQVNGSNVDTNYGVLPAFNLNLSSVLFSSASGESKSSDFTTGTTINSSGNTWNLTLQAGSGFAATRKSGETGNVEAGNSLTVYVSNAGTPDAGSGVTFNQISAMLVDDEGTDAGTVVAYGKIADNVPADGNISVTIPSTGVADGDYQLKVFAEKVYSLATPNLTDYATNMASIDVTVQNSPPAPTPTPHHDDSDNSSDSDSNSGSSSSTKEEAYVNPLVWNYAANQTGSLCLIEHQGPLCVAAFNQATPKIFKEAFSFNLLLKENGYYKPSYVKKTGKFVLTIPKEWQKKGRTFMLIGIDKFGKTKTFSDMDMSDKTFTTTLDVEGYAFSLIYKDSLAKNKWVYITRQ